MDKDFIDKIMDTPDLLQMGHGQTSEDRNLGMGWIYYSLSRLYKPERVVCIGSWRGFVPMLIAKGMIDNLKSGELIFIDPSMVDDFWKDESIVSSYFNEWGLSNIKHYKMTTQEFKESEIYKNLGKIDILFVDGLHTYDQAKFDHQTFEPFLSDKSICFFHDSIESYESDIYGDDNKYEYSVNRYMSELKNLGYQVLDIPFEFGLSIVRK
jgi:predicted O-methyltransferase YrrM